MVSFHGNSDAIFHCIEFSCFQPLKMIRNAQLRGIASASVHNAIGCDAVVA
ncbi:hypothetical protein RMSM_00460 [Rhodopirellula maiorica SM1]|uniref:Uncharacterized protein n=1 Tax=Rhodopirellula maiorica SM1 TaxID=1265738 RepID=M5RTE8_9BACT|nr:hypothetical protein RMSM_00460 [Rhodopirellula maiorica SM1]